MSEQEEKTTYSIGHVVIAFVTGALAGVATALLTSPITGRQSRDYLGRLAGRSKDTLSRAPEMIRRTFGKGKEQVEDYPEQKRSET